MELRKGLSIGRINWKKLIKPMSLTFTTIALVCSLTGCSKEDRFFKGVKDISGVSYVSGKSGDIELEKPLSYLLVDDTNVCLITNKMTGESWNTIAYSSDENNYMDLIAGKTLTVDAYDFIILASSAECLENPDLIRYSGYYLYDLRLLLKEYEERIEPIKDKSK